MSLKIIFMGTPEFAVPALKELIKEKFDIVHVYTQPPKKSNRGLKIEKTPIHVEAEKNNLNIHHPSSLKNEQELNFFRKINPDLVIVVAYGQIIPENFLSLSKKGFINIHASLLPRWRGAAPIHRAIEKGDSHTGVTIMQMNIGLDTGDMLLHDSLPIEDQDTTLSLHDKLADMGGKLCIEAIAGLEQKQLTAQVQPSEGVCYAEKISKSESAIVWSRSAIELSRLIRALNPAPGASCQIGPDSYKIWMAQADSQLSSLPKNSEIGTVLQANEAGIWIQTGDGVLHISQIQRAGSKKMPLADMLRGKPITVGTVCNKDTI